MKSEYEKIRPLADRVLIRRLPLEEMHGPIVIPDIAQNIKEAPIVRGVVVATGPGKRLKDGSRKPMEVKRGDMVLIGPYVDFERDDLVMCNEADIRGVY